MEPANPSQQAGLLSRAFLRLSVMGSALVFGVPMAIAGGIMGADKLASVPELAGVDLAARLGNASLTVSAGITALVGLWAFARGLRCGLAGGSIADEPLHVRYPFLATFILSAAATAILVLGSRTLPRPLLQLLPYVGGTAVFVGGLGVLASIVNSVMSAAGVLVRFGRRTTARALGLGLAAPVLALSLSGVTAPLLDRAGDAADRAVRALEVEEGLPQDDPPLLLGGLAPMARLPERRQTDPVFDSCVAELTAGTDGQIGGAVADARRSVAAKVGAAEAEDIAMDMLIEVCLRHSSSRLRELRTYYFGSVRNEVYQRAGDSQRRSRLLRLQGSAQESCHLSPEAAAITDEEHLVLRALIEALPVEDRRLLQAYGDGRRYRDIAAEVGISEVAARKRVHRLVVRLGNDFRQHCQ